jgi:hypothetical protein
MITPKQQLQASLSNLDKSVTATVHSRLSTIHTNDGNLTKQTKTLQARTAEARQHEENWSNLVRAGRNGMKVRTPSHMSLHKCVNGQDLGDAGNWASFLDREITFLENVIQQTRQ